MGEDFLFFGFGLHGGLLEYVRRVLREMKPGDCLNLPRLLLDEIAAPPGFTAADWILEGIVGSAYTLMYRDVPSQPHTIQFRRLAHRLTLCASPERFAREPELRSYVSPDRRHLFRQRHDGLWERH